MEYQETILIEKIWESYPVFNSYDSSDGRSYNNYMFSKNPYTEEMMELYCKQVKMYSDAYMVHEDILPALLHILYYNGDSDNVLLASSKKRKRWFHVF